MFEKGHILYKAVIRNGKYILKDVDTNQIVKEFYDDLIMLRWLKNKGFRDILYN